MDFSDGSNNSDLPEAFNDASSVERLERLKEALSKAVLGQQEVVDRLASTLLTAPKGAGKTEATLKAMAKAGEKVTVVTPEDFKNGAMDPAAGRVFFIDEFHLKSDQEIQDAIDVFMGRPTRGQLGEKATDADLPGRKQLGEMAAQQFRDGTVNAVTCMKPLRLKPGFCISM
ncbi:MAG: hypothetical protein EPN97_10000 [Alphaproteobacteria bacterium]|nr:MAG: hypothetical protein EPN97_10000 [Alphaproteobacteria bacterium]